MLPSPSSENPQPGLFQPLLRDMLDSQDPLIALADAIDWSFFEKEFALFYAEEGRPAKRIRLMVELLLLKQIENLSDERVVLEWKRNPYYQYFCGMQEYVPALPCHATELVKFRQRIGVEGVERIFSQSVALHGKTTSSWL
jgi:IS5 family transposase